MHSTSTKNFIKHITTPIAVTSVIFVICLILDNLPIALLAVLIGFAWVTLTIYRIVDRKILYVASTAARAGQMNTNESLQKIKEIKNDTATVQRNTSATVNSIKSIESVLEENLSLSQRIDRRILKNGIIVGNVAGSAGRSAPIIRDIQSTVNNLARATTSPSSHATTKASSHATTTAVSQSAGKQQPQIQFSFPSVEPTSAEPVFSDVKVMVVADEFTARAFAYEWTIIEPTPDNWKSITDEFQPDFLFVESAWEANAGAWRYHLVGQTAPRPAVVEMVEYCKTKGIPTVFWNKEDPPHFEEFLPTAQLFDYVFTTDGNLVHEYKKRLGHNNIDVLPFAAQPKIHNPARIGMVNRDRDIVFGGMYFREKYPERRDQLDMILPAAVKFNLDIYSRNSGEDSKYRFPDEYIKKVRGTLPYPQMLTAYHAYKAVINVNSVVDSNTMCARRIFEATACGAAVVTGSTGAIRNFFPNQMLTEVSGEDDAYHKIRALLRSDEYRERRVHVAQRHVFQHHTYTQRAVQVMRQLGINVNVPQMKRSFFITTNRPSNLEVIFQNFERQVVENKELVILTHGFEPTDLQIESLSQKYKISNLTLLSAPASQTLGANLNQLTDACNGDVLFRMDDDDFYGANYALDLENALKFSGAALAGKAASYIYFEEMNSTVLTYSSHENRYTDFVRGATFCGWKDTFERFRFPELERSEDSSFLEQVKRSGEKIYASDRFNLLVMRRADKTTHTWTVDDAKLFATGDMKFVGSDTQQIEI